MNGYIIDTHIFLWLIFAPQKISKKKLDVLKNPKNAVYISSITFWEISIKFNLGKLSLEGLAPNDLPNIAQQMGIEILDIDADIMASFYQLPSVAQHRDPFDRIIIWKCLSDDYTLISEDSKLSNYQPLGLLTL